VGKPNSKFSWECNKKDVSPEDTPEGIEDGDALVFWATLVHDGDPVENPENPTTAAGKKKAAAEKKKPTTATGKKKAAAEKKKTTDEKKKAAAEKKKKVNVTAKAKGSTKKCKGAETETKSEPTKKPKANEVVAIRKSGRTPKPKNQS
jgi:hypothetical protein